MGHGHAHGEKDGGDDDDERLHNVEVIHVHVVSKHVVITGNIGRLITPGQLRSDNQEYTPASQDSEHCTACELIIADSRRHFGRHWILRSRLNQIAVI